MNNYNYLTMMILGKHHDDYREMTSLINSCEYERQSYIEGIKVGARLVMELWED